MEGSGTGISRLDSYEDMFKEITRKLYGEDPDHRTSSVQNEFETSVSYKNDEDTGNGTDGSDDGNWTCEEEPLKGTDGSRIAAYHAGKATWRCYECGDVMGGGPREVAEHFMELHSSRILADERNRHHSPRKDYLMAELKVEEVISYLERLRERAERAAPPSRRTQETQTVPAALLPMTSTFLLQELPSAPAPQHLHQSSPTMAASPTVSASGKRYTCPYCPYGTDRRDLYTRHENIHREEKPFHCYICYKPFNRADHVKKHFLRMHREHGYELSRIRRPVGSSAPKPLQQESGNGGASNGNANGPQQQQQQQQQQHPSYPSGFTANKAYQLQPNPGSGAGAGTAGGIYQATSMPAPGIMQPDASNCTPGGRRVQNGGCNSKSHLKGGSKGAQERRYTCCYCSWSGVDNWCLKRHLNTHLKPFACTLCEYKAARAERLATHVLKVHNRRQCSRCSFLGEDAAQLQMHQLHVHRVSSANAPATSTGQAAPAPPPPPPPPPPPNNRHQQPLHPAGGGRPPPGPPVFPAPAPAIAPATTVIPPTTILGPEMVNSPATAATMAYLPTEEEEDEDEERKEKGTKEDGRSWRNRASKDRRVEFYHDEGDLDDEDEDGDAYDDADVDRDLDNDEDEDEDCRYGTSPRCACLGNDGKDDCPETYATESDQLEPCAICQDSSKTATSHADSCSTLIELNRDFTYSYQWNVCGDEGAVGRKCSLPWGEPDSPHDTDEENDKYKRPGSNAGVSGAKGGSSGGGGGGRRSRKQSQPRKVSLEAWSQECEDEDLLLAASCAQSKKQEDSSRLAKRKTPRLTKLRKLIHRRRPAQRRLYRCHMCPEDAPARGSVYRAYHTKVSLALHKLWRHAKREKRVSRSALTSVVTTSVTSSVSVATNTVSASASRIDASGVTHQESPRVSSITLKATVFTSPGYAYHPR